MIIACVRTGSKYPVEYVARLQRAVKRCLPAIYSFVCLTDGPAELQGQGVHCVDISPAAIGVDLPGWWGKMYLFARDWRAGERVLYFDLDSVPVGDLSALAELEPAFGICENFTRAAGSFEWPCRYGSCVMTIGPEFAGHIWKAFAASAAAMMADAGRYGDQFVIERLAPHAALLQYLLPPGFFVGYRELPNLPARPPAAGVVIFAGRHKPHNTTSEWVRAAWA